MKLFCQTDRLGFATINRSRISIGIWAILQSPNLQPGCVENPVDLGMCGHSSEQFRSHRRRDDDATVQSLQHGLQTKSREVAKAGSI